MNTVTNKPWGSETLWAKTKSYAGKILYIKKGHRLSLQHHDVKEESIRILSGTMILEIESDDGHINSVELTESMSFHIPPKTIHRMSAVTDTYVLEVSTPELDDVVRHQDDYDRA